MSISLVSVIVPIYNVAPYLNACVDSILSQSYRKLEIILVDDGSEDDGGKRCDEYAAQDDRVRVIHKDNGGLAEARNSGIDASHGKYLLFVDGDDFIGETHVQDLVWALRESRASIALGELQRVPFDQGLGVVEAQETVSYRDLTSEGALEELFYQRISNSACGKLYRRELFKTLRYPSGALYEDLGLTYLVLAQANKIAQCRTATYYYVQRPGSIMRMKDLKRRCKAIEFVNEAIKFSESYSPELIRAARSRKFIECVTITCEADSVQEIRREFPEISRTIKTERLQVVMNRRASPTMRMYAVASLFGLGAVRKAGDIRSWLKRT